MVTGNPVFIFGGARSGTTFLAKLFDSHPDVLYFHEPDSVLNDPAIPFLPRHEEIESLLPQAASYLDALCQVRVTKVSGQRPIFDKSYRSALKKRIFTANLYLAKLTERTAHPFVKGSLSLNIRISSRAPHVPVIKSVNSPLRAFLFSQAKPHWRYIHIVRHPCAVINSRLRGIDLNLMGTKTHLHSLFNAGMTQGYPYTLEELDKLNYEERVAFGWMVANQRICDDMSGCENYRRVIYEDLCRNLTSITQNLFDFAGFSFDDQTRGFIAQLEASEERDHRYFDVMRSPMSALDKWREQLSRQQIESIEYIVCQSAIGRHFFDSD